MFARLNVPFSLPPGGPLPVHLHLKHSGADPRLRGLTIVGGPALGGSGWWFTLGTTGALRPSFPPPPAGLLVLVPLTPNRAHPSHCLHLPHLH